MDAEERKRLVLEKRPFHKKCKSLMEEKWSEAVLQSACEYVRKFLDEQLWLDVTRDGWMNSASICELVNSIATAHPAACDALLQAGASRAGIVSATAFGGRSKDVAAASMLSLAALWTHVQIRGTIEASFDFSYPGPQELPLKAPCLCLWESVNIYYYCLKE